MLGFITADLSPLVFIARSAPRSLDGPAGPPRATPETVGVSSVRLQRIGEAIKRHIDEHHISGAVTLVARKGFVVHHEAHGLKDIEAKTPMTRDTIFKMASSTKPVTGVAIMILVEEGKVHLADPVSRFIPEFKDMKVAVEKEGSSDVELVKADREITVRDLLTHTSGLLSGGAGLAEGAAGPDVAEGRRHPGEARPPPGPGPARFPAGIAVEIQRAGRHRHPRRGSSRSPRARPSTSSCGSGSSSLWA